MQNLEDIKIVLQSAIDNQPNNNYCDTFRTPIDEVLDLFKPSELRKITNSFVRDYEIDPSVLLLNNQYYHTLLFLLTSNMDDLVIVKQTLTLLGFSLYNGRLISSIGMPNMHIMATTISNMPVNSLVSKYDTPFKLVSEYFTTKISQKIRYIENLDNPLDSKKILCDLFNRIRHVFRYNYVNGEYLSGIQPTYNKILNS